MECELPMLLFTMPILPKALLDRLARSGSIFEYA